MKISYNTLGKWTKWIVLLMVIAMVISLKPSLQIRRFYQTVGRQMPAINEQLVQQIQSENKYLRSELTATRQALADIQAELAEASQRAEESSKRSDTIILQMTQQLERANLQIEDFTRNQTVWQRVKAIFTSQPA